MKISVCHDFNFNHNAWNDHRIKPKESSQMRPSFSEKKNSLKDKTTKYISVQGPCFRLWWLNTNIMDQSGTIQDQFDEDFLPFRAVSTQIVDILLFVFISATRGTHYRRCWLVAEEILPTVNQLTGSVLRNTRIRDFEKNVSLE